MPGQHFDWAKTASFLILPIYYSPVYVIMYLCSLRYWYHLQIFYRKERYFVMRSVVPLLRSRRLVTARPQLHDFSFSLKTRTISLSAPFAGLDWYVEIPAGLYRSCAAKETPVLFLVWDKNVWFCIRLLYVRSYMKYLAVNYFCKRAVASNFLLPLSVCSWLLWNDVYKKGFKTCGDVFTVTRVTRLLCTMTQVKYISELGNFRIA
jgi:hypothetical protein